MSSNLQIPLDDNGKPGIAGYDATGHQVVAIAVSSITTDSTTGIKSGSLNIGGTVTANNASVGATEAAIPASATLLGANDGAGNLEELMLESNANPNLRITLFQGSSQATKSK